MTNEAASGDEGGPCCPGGQDVPGIEFDLQPAGVTETAVEYGPWHPEGVRPVPPEER